MSSAGWVRLLHAVRVLGYADTTDLALRARVDGAGTADLLLDAEALGLVTRSTFDDLDGWSLTERGKREGERLLAEELDGAGSGAREAVEQVVRDFEPLNGVVTAACTRWQLAELGMSAAGVTVDDVLVDLRRAGRDLAGLEARLVAQLPRFAGYRDRFEVALERATDEPAWITSTDRDSAHRVWFELHEDLLATLGRAR